MKTLKVLIFIIRLILLEKKLSFFEIMLYIFNQTVRK